MYPTGTLGPLGSFNDSVGGSGGPPVFVSNTINFSANSSNLVNYVPVQINTNGLILQSGQAYVIGLTTADPNSSDPGVAYPTGINDNFNTSQGFASVALVPSHPNGDGHGGYIAPQAVGLYPGGVFAGYGGNLGGLGDFASLLDTPYWNNLNNPGGDAYVFPGHDYGDLAYSADFQPTFTLTGTVAPLTQDLTYKELVYSLSDGVTTVKGTEQLSGSCAALAICPFSQTLSYAAPAGSYAHFGGIYDSGLLRQRPAIQRCELRIWVLLGLPESRRVCADEYRVQRRFPGFLQPATQ